MYRLAALSVLFLAPFISSLPAGAETAPPQRSGDPPAMVALSPEGAWPGFRHDAQHSGRAAVPGPVMPAVKWRFNLGTVGYSSPAIDENGNVYAGAADGVHAFDAGGDTLWSFRASEYVISSPAVAGGVVYAGSWDDNVYAIDAATGTRIWTFPTSDDIWASPTIGSDGTVYIGSTDGHLYALDPATGAEKWSFETGAEVVSSAAIGTDGTLYFGSLDNNVYAVSPEGALRWVMPTGGNVVSSPAVSADGTVYAGSRDSNLYALSPAGALIWSYETTGEIISSPAIGADGSIYVGSRDGRLHAVRPDGTAKWAAVQTESEVYSSPAVDSEGTVFIGSVDGHLYAVDGSTGQVRWRFAASGPIWTSPTLSDERTIYFTSNNEATQAGTLFAVGSAPFEVTFAGETVAGEPSILRTRPISGTLSGQGLLYFRRGGERVFQPPVPMTAVGDGSFQAEIPAAFATLRGIEYYVAFTDGEQVATFPIFRAEERPAFRTVRVVQETTPALLQPLRYEMVSVPLALDDPSIDAVLGDDYETYLNTRWRLFRWEEDGYREFSEIGATFTPGTSFFLITSDGRPFDIDEGHSVSTEVPYEVVLRPGLNQVANPYAFPILWDDVAHDPEVVRVVATFDSETNEMVQDPSQLQVLQPWTGYFISNRSDGPVTIAFTPREANSGTIGEGEDLLVRSAVRTPREGAVINLQAHLRGHDLADTQNWIGFLPDAAAGIDRRDLEEAPPIGDFVQLSVLEQDQRWAGNFRAAGSPGEQWDVVLRTSQRLPERGGLPVDVTFHHEQALPEGYQVHVLDLDSGRPIPADGGRFSVVLSQDTPERHLRILVGTAAFVQDPGHEEALPERFALEQNYPNPFNPETVIRYQVDRQTRVELAIYNVMGQRVRTLISEVQGAGPYEAVWDGLDDAGQAVASGVYLYRLTAGPHQATRKMLLLR